MRQTQERWHGEPGKIGSFFLRASGEPSEASGRVNWADVAAWEVTATDTSGATYYFGTLEESATSVDKATPYVSGFVKWDGCSEFDWRETHSCDKRTAVRIGEVIGALYDLAEALMRPSDTKSYRGE